MFESFDAQLAGPPAPSTGASSPKSTSPLALNAEPRLLPPLGARNFVRASSAGVTVFGNVPPEYVSKAVKVMSNAKSFITLEPQLTQVLAKHISNINAMVPDPKNKKKLLADAGVSKSRDVPESILLSEDIAAFSIHNNINCITLKEYKRCFITYLLPLLVAEGSSPHELSVKTLKLLALKFSKIRQEGTSSFAGSTSQYYAQAFYFWERVFSDEATGNLPSITNTFRSCYRALKNNETAALAAEDRGLRLDAWIVIVSKLHEIDTEETVNHGFDSIMRTAAVAAHHRCDPKTALEMRKKAPRQHLNQILGAATISAPQGPAGPVLSGPPLVHPGAVAKAPMTKSTAPAPCFGVSKAAAVVLASSSASSSSTAMSSTGLTQPPRAKRRRITESLADVFGAPAAGLDGSSSDDSGPEDVNPSAWGSEPREQGHLVGERLIFMGDALAGCLRHFVGLALLAWFTAIRPSDWLRLVIADSRDAFGRKCRTVTLASSKTDPFGVGSSWSFKCCCSESQPDRSLPKGLPICPVHCINIKQYESLAGLLTQQKLDSVFSTILAENNLPQVKAFHVRHLTRIGFAMAASDSGLSEDAIAKIGGWRAPSSVALYRRNALQLPSHTKLAAWPIRIPSFLGSFSAAQFVNRVKSGATIIP
jgi:hypothetical protein